MSLSKCVRLGGFTLIMLFLGFSPLMPDVFAVSSPESPWLGTNLPTLEKISEVNLAVPLPASIIGNRDCQAREVITRPRRYAAPIQSKISQPGCVTDTGSGAYSTSGFLQRQGSDIYGSIRTDRGSTAIMLPVPGSSTTIRISPAAAEGAYLFFYDNLEPNINSSAIFNGEVTHKLPLHNAILANGDGTLLSVATESASFSANGDWMVADIPNIAVSRINVKTREVLPFGNAINYGIGLGPAYRTAISPDGRYAFVYSRNFDILRLYDLSTCSVPPAVIKTKVPCESRDLMPFMREQVPGFTSLASVRFLSNYALDIYANSLDGQTNKLTRYAATAAGQQQSGFQYLALGDSFASGEGAYQYKAATDVTDNKCHLSQRSYPYLISSVLGYGQSESVACSGAVIEDIVTHNPDYLGQNKNKVPLNRRDYDDYLPFFLPGYLPQIEFGHKHQPAAITISAGGNDIGFSDIIIRCLGADNCYKNYEDRFEVANLINKQFDPLTSMYYEVKKSVDPRAKIYVVGYPEIAKPGGNCAANVHLNNDEIVFSGQLVRYLNSVIKKAAAKAGVYYIDVEEAFNGHKLCETDSWNVAINGLTAGNDRLNLPYVHGPIANESYHPNGLGHKLLKTKILEKTSNFTAPMPEPNPTIEAGDIDLTDELLQAPRSNRAITRLRHYQNTDGDSLRAGELWSLRLTKLDLIFAANSSIQAWLHSDPVALGTFTIDSQGAINLTATVPGSTPAGFHTLHLLGKNSSGESTDLFKTVYVDSKGNESTCVVVPESGQDTDKDDIDDACDPIIDDPPLAVVPLPGFGPPPAQPPANPPPDTSFGGINPKERGSDPETEAPGIVIVPPLQGSSNTFSPAAGINPNNQLQAATAIPAQTDEPTAPVTSVAGANTSTPSKPITAIAISDPLEINPEPISKLYVQAFAALTISLAAAATLKLRQHHK